MNPSILIAYYSWSGHTKAVAEEIQRKTGGTLFEICPQTPYPKEYQACVKQVKTEKEQDFCPQLLHLEQCPSDFDTLFVGSPNWWGTLVPPVTAFVSSVGLAGKRVLPFFSHGGGGKAKMQTDLARLCPDARVEEALCVMGDGGTKQKEYVQSWLEQQGFV